MTQDARRSDRLAVAMGASRRARGLPAARARATMTNRALLFRSDFWAGGMPISGEWYLTRDDGTSWGADDFSARRTVVANGKLGVFTDH